MKIILSILSVFLAARCFAQTETYCQSDASFFSNCYTFNRADKTFTHEIASDDGQIWWGQGSYTETNKQINLVYAATDSVSIDSNELIKRNIMNFRPVRFKPTEELKKMGEGFYTYSVWVRRKKSYFIKKQ
jgi:hypothetical protein